MSAFPRGPMLYEHGMLVAHRTAAVDGSPAELWELQPGVATRGAWTSAEEGERVCAALLADFARLSQTYPLRCFGRVVHASESQLVLSAPPWVSLTALIERARGQVETAFAVTWLRELAADLATAPSLVLRALTPSALAITVAGAPRILDLLLAQFPGATGNVPGFGWAAVIPFVAPEQTRGLELDARRDIWGLAVIALELLTGTRVFRGDDFDILEQIRAGEVPELPRLRDRPRPLVRLLDGMLAHDPADRPAAADLVATIERELAAELWSPEQMFAEVRRLAPIEAEAAIVYGY